MIRGGVSCTAVFRAAVFILWAFNDSCSLIAVFGAAVAVFVTVCMAATAVFRAIFRAVFILWAFKGSYGFFRAAVASFRAALFIAAVIATAMFRAATRYSIKEHFDRSIVKMVTH